MYRHIDGTPSASRFMPMACLAAASYVLFFAIADALLEQHFETPSQMLARVVLVSAVLLAGLIVVFQLQRREQMAIADADHRLQEARRAMLQRTAQRLRPSTQDLEGGLAVVVASPRPAAVSARVVGRLRPALTRREREVAALIARGCTSKAIADALVISERTADTHADHIRSKLGLRSRTEIAAWVLNNGHLMGPQG